MPARAPATGIAFLLAPGAGAPSSHPRMRTFARLLGSTQEEADDQILIAVARFLKDVVGRVP